MEYKKPTKRKIEHEKETAKYGKSEEDLLPENSKKKKQCHFENPLHLGFCNLNEISYYDCLKLKFDPDKRFSIDFIKSVNIAVNKTLVEVRPLKLNENLFQNKVSDIIALIENARFVLTNSNRKTKYDIIIKEKLNDKLNVIDDFIPQTIETGNLLQSKIKEFRNFIIRFPTKFSDAFDESKINDPDIILMRNIDVRVKILFLETLNKNSKKRQIKQRSSTMNRIQIDWPLFDTEVNMSREDIAENVIKREFEKFGEIKSVFICPMEKNRAIVEYFNVDSVRKALSENESKNTRYTVKEFLVSSYYSPTLMLTMENKINDLSKKIENVNSSLLNKQ